MKQLIRFDWAIKRLLRQKANFGILEGFLSELLKEDIKIDEILESETNQDTKNDKYNKVDLLVRNVMGELIIIEIQNNMESDYLQRILYGASKVLVENMYEGEPYSEVKNIICVNIVFFDLGQGDDYVYHGTTKYEGLHKHDILKLTEKQQILFKTDDISKLYPEYYIIKVDKFDEVAIDTLDEWIYFFKKEEIKDSFKAKGLKQAKDTLAVLKLSDKERKEYKGYLEQKRYEASMVVTNHKASKIEGMLEGREEGIKIGEENKEKFAEERARQTKIEMAIKCLKRRMDLMDIIELTGLSEDEIIELKY